MRGSLPLRKADFGQQYIWPVSYTHLSKYPRELSGGEKQRIAIARALFNDPPLLLADEPTGNLDEKTRKIVENIFDDLNKKAGKTILLVTHDLEFAQKAKRRYALKEGRLRK